jgi:predicted dehydrogenase
MSTPLRVGLVGFGLAGRVFHAPFIAAHPGLHLAAIVTASAPRAQAAKAAHPDANVVAALDALGALDLDLLVLGGPPSTHRAQAVWALEHDLAVIVDKPFMPTVGDALDVLALAEARGGRITVFHNRRWDGDFLAVRQLVTDAALGDVFEIESSFEHWDPSPARDWKLSLPVTRGGGVTMDLGSHLVDQAIQLSGPVTDVEADLRGLRPSAGNDDVATLRLTHLSGRRSTLRMSRLSSQPGARFRVSGTAGSATIHGLDPQEALLEAGVSVAELADAQARSPRTAVIRSVSTVREEILPAGDYAGFYSAAVAWLRGDADAPVDPYSALEVLRVLERATAGMRLAC